MWIDSITGVSAHFSAITGSKITASQIMVSPDITGNSAFFTTITGFNEYLQQLTVAEQGVSILLLLTLTWVSGSRKSYIFL